ncbi:MAG TPA: glycosyltransferase family 39 protein [Bryobacteraceae bacterium]|nr:glycosyltransferase family 39 protein [Bryobacteraceae bacterium]
MQRSIVFLFGKQQRFVTVPLLFALYLAVLLLLVGHKPLWLDEIWQQLRTRNVSFDEMVSYARHGAGGAFLPHFCQWLILKVLPYSAAVSRLPSLLFGFGAAVCFWLQARELKLKVPEIAVALWMALPIVFRYTLEARPYSPALFFDCWALLLLFQLDEQPSARRSVRLLLVAAATLYSHPFAIFEILAIASLLAGTSLDWRRKLPYLVLPVLASFLLYLPWYLSASKEWSNGLASEGTIAVFDTKLPLRVLREYTGGGYVVGLGLLALVVLGLQIPGRRRTKLVLAAGFAAGLIVPLLAEQKLHYFYAARHLMFALPSGVLLGAYAFESRMPSRQVLARLLLLAVLIGSAATITIKETGPQEDWRPVADRLHQLSLAGNCIASADPDGLVYYAFFRPSLNKSECRSSEKAVVLVANPYTPLELDKIKARELLEKGYEETGKEQINGFRIALFARSCCR